MACLPVKRPLCRTAHVAVTLGVCAVLSISEKCWRTSAALLQQLTYLRSLVAKQSPPVCLTCLSFRIQLHPTPIASSPEWQYQGLVAIDRHHGVGSTVAHVLALARLLII
jgi:hypothetical protein